MLARSRERARRREKAREREREGGRRWKLIGVEHYFLLVDLNHFFAEGDKIT